MICTVSHYAMRRFLTNLFFALLLLSAATEAKDYVIHVGGTRHKDYRGTPKLEFPEGAAGKVKSADEYLRTHHTLFKIPADLSNLELVSVRQSLTGSHTRYRQTLNDLLVEGAEIIVSQRKADGSVYQVYNNTYPVEIPVPAAKKLSVRMRLCRRPGITCGRMAV